MQKEGITCDVSKISKSEIDAANKIAMNKISMI